MLVPRPRVQPTFESLAAVAYGPNAPLRTFGSSPSPLRFWTRFSMPDAEGFERHPHPDVGSLLQFLIVRRELWLVRPHARPPAGAPHGDYYRAHLPGATALFYAEVRSWIPGYPWSFLLDLARVRCQVQETEWADEIMTVAQLTPEELQAETALWALQGVTLGMPHCPACPDGRLYHLREGRGCHHCGHTEEAMAPGLRAHLLAY